MKVPGLFCALTRGGRGAFVRIFLSGWLLAGSAWADEFRGAQDSNFVIVDWQVPDGLPSARIQDVVQTKDGYLWLATPDGLARFDGIRFERFYDLDTPGLASSMVSCLLEDSRGRLWYGTLSGEIGWKDAAGFHELNFLHSGPMDTVERFVETADGTVWAATRHALLPIKDRLAGTLLIRPENHDVWDICAADNGGLWVLVDGGNVYRLDSESGKMSLVIPGQSGQWRNITPAHAGGLWVRDGQCIRRWQAGAWVEDRGVIDLQVTENTVMRESKSGVLMIGTSGEGLWLLESDGREYKLNHISGLTQDQVLSLCEDREKNLWVGTVHGLNRLSRRVVKMITPADNWQNRAISSIAPAANGGFWVGTEGAGLYRISPDGRVSAQPTFDVWHQDFRCVLEDTSGQIWAGVFNYGLWLRDKQHPKGQYLPNPTSGYPNALFQDSRQVVWVGTTMGAANYKLGSRTPSQILLTNADVRCFAEAGDGSIWMGLQDGRLFRCDQKTGQVSQLSNKKSSSSIHALHCAADGTLWVGTRRNGLAFLKDERWRTLTREQGLPDDSISDIRSDEQGNLWIGSASGIFRIGQKQLEQFAAGEIKSVNCLQLGSGDGLGLWEIMGGYQPIACRTADGRLWYVSSVGLAMVDSQAIKPNQLPPPVVIVSVQADGKPISNATAPLDLAAGKNTVRCPAGTRQLEIRYTALSFSSPKQVRFRYRLEGFDRRWIEAVNQRVVNFSHLPPGRYNFEVTACNNHGVWNETGARVSFQVLPLFWQTAWFKLILALATVAVIAFFYRIRLARLRALERLRQQIARDLHDEVGANLGSISLLTEVMEKRPQPGDLAQIRSTADQTVDTLRDLVWIINPSHEYLSDLVARLKQIAAIMLANLDYKFAEMPANNLKLSLEVRRNLPPLLKEILNNIRKHSRATQVTIRLCCQAGNLLLEVTDNGVGFDPASKKSGDGLKNFQNRAAEMRAELMVTSQPNRGTTVRLTAPLTQSRDWWKPF